MVAVVPDISRPAVQPIHLESDVGVDVLHEAGELVGVVHREEEVKMGT
jgi:hypothetical protein